MPVQFVASVSDATSYSYQWFQGDTPIENATNSTLILTNTTFASAGQYRLRASNDSVNVESSAATLTILPPVQLRHVAYALAGSYLEAIDVSNPREPARLSRTNLNITVTDINVNGNYAYVSALQGFRVFDVSNPARMLDVGRNNSYPG